MSADVQYDLLRFNKLCSIFGLDLDRLWRHESAGPHDQFGATLRVGVEMEGNFAVDHGPLALPDDRHIRLDGVRYRAKRPGLSRHMANPGAPNFVLAGQAGHARTGASHPLTFHDSRAFPRLRQMPGQSLAALPAAQNDRFEVSRLRHLILHGSNVAD